MAKRKAAQASSVEQDDASVHMDVDEQLVSDDTQGFTRSQSDSLSENEIENQDLGEGEESAEDEDEESSDEEDERPSKKQKSVPKLTAQDVQTARETAELFKSNIFKLEIDELIKELRLKDSHVKLIERVLHKLHDIINQIPDSESFTLSEADHYFKESKNKVAIPFPDPKPSSLNYKLNYSAPSNIALVGSFGLKTGVHQPSGMSVDVSLTMPKSLFQPKDYLNYRALYKRSFYIAYLTDKLVTLSKKNHLPIKISYEYLNDDKLCPTILIESYQPDEPHPDQIVFQKTNISIRLLIGFEFGLFESKKLLPDRNCIRIQNTDSNSALSQPPTPLYNSSILSSTTSNYYLKYLYTTKKSADAFRDACVLGKLWLNQRGFTSKISNGGFGHFEFAMLMAALLQGGGNNSNKILLHGFSSYQLFKGVIKYLSTQDLCNDGYLSFSSVIGENKSIYKNGGFNVPTIFDKFTKINLLWKMTPASYKLLKREATETLNLLNDVVRDRFRQIFILNNTKGNLKFDLTMYIPLNSISEENFGPIEKLSFITFENFITSKIYRILSRALDVRATEIIVKVVPNNSKWSILKRKASSSSDSLEKQIMIGINLNSSECEKKVTKGPLHSDKVKGEQFQAFWGNKAQVRKYKDGSIQYSVLWPNSSTEPVVLNIVRYILSLHLSEDISKELTSSSSYYHKLLPAPLVASSSTQPLILPSSYQTLKNSYDELCKTMQTLDLPLMINSILPISPSLRNTSLLLPVPFATSNPDFFNESILQFETSIKWPDELIALEKTKAAFLLKICDELNNSTEYKSYITKDEETIPFNKEIVILNVLTPDGFGFTFRVLTERDESLYLRAIETASDKQKQSVTDIYLKFNQKYMGSVKHHRAINSLVTFFPFYSPTVRLLKRFLNSQLLLNHFPEEVVELITMKVFVDPAPYLVPSSAESGFVRVLQFLSSWNWKEDPLILDLSKDGSIFSTDPTSSSSENESYIDKISDKLTVQSYQSMMASFSRLRKEDPSAIKTQYFIASKEDPSGKLWTSNNISIPIASRLTALAMAAISRLSKESSKLNHKSIELFFTPALQDYDFYVNLKIENDISASSGILPENAFKNLITSVNGFPEDLSLTQDPVQGYYKELVSLYGNNMILSTKKYTGLNEKGNTNVIAGLFNPSVTNGKKKFKVNIGYNTIPSDNDQLEYNKNAVLEEIVALGGEMVTSFKSKQL